MIVESLLLEMSIDDIYDKYYSDVPRQDFERIIAADPTSKPNKMGKYGKWLLSLYQRGALKIGDLGEAKECLEYFSKYINRIEIKDINRYKSVRELYDVVAPFMQDPTQATSKTDAMRRQKHEEAEKVYEDGEWMVIVPHTQAASCLYGKGTKWCTAADSSQNMFDYYNSKGKLYININKGNGQKYQFHFETCSFMDAEDEEIERPIPETIGMSKGLAEFYKQKIGAEGYLRLIYPYATQMDNDGNIWGVEIDDDKWIYAKSDGTPLIGGDMEFSNIWAFKDGLAKVGTYMTASESKGENYYENGDDYGSNDYYGGESVEEYYNYINENGEFLSKVWFYKAGNFYGNFACVGLEEVQGGNLLKRDGSYLLEWGKYRISEQPRKGMWKIYDFRTKKYNAINDNGQLVSPKLWFDGIDYPMNAEMQYIFGYIMKGGGYRRYRIYADGRVFDPYADDFK